MKKLRPLLVLLALASALGSQGTERDYAFVFLVTGPDGDKLSPSERDEAMAGHFSNMERMAGEAQLCLAGPLGEPRADPVERGLYVFDARTVEQAEAWTATDPAVAAGIFDMRILPFRSTSDFGALLRLESVKRDREPKGETPMRSYVLATAENYATGRRVLTSMREEGLVFFDGRFGGDLEGIGLFALDVTDMDEARDMLAFAGESAGESLEWGLRPWFATEDVTRLPELDARPRPAPPTFEVETLTEDEARAHSKSLDFNRRIDVFGIPVLAQAGESEERLLAEARSLARVLDPHEDGEVDVPAILDALLQGGGFVGVFTHGGPGAPEVEGLHWRSALAAHAHGQRLAFPAVFQGPESRLGRAQERARSDTRFKRVEGWDVGFGSKALRTFLGDEEIGKSLGWPTADYLRMADPDLVELFLDERYGFPTALPDGTYGVGRLPEASFSFDADRVTTGRVYDYILSNLDGSHPKRISVYVPEALTLEVLKWDPKEPSPTLVEARIDARTLAPESFHTQRLSRGGRETVAVMEVDEDRTELVANVGEREFRAPLRPGPWHSHDFDLLSLGFSMRHLETHACHFAFQRVDPVVRDGDVTLANVGDVRVRYLRDEKHNGYGCHVYGVDGPGLEGRGGTLWIAANDERFVVDQHLDLPAEGGFESSRLRLIEVTTLDRETWDAFLERRTR